MNTSRILIFSTKYLPSVGGAELALKEITDRLKGVDFDLITSSSNPNLPKQEKIGNVNVYRITETFDFLLPKNFYPLAAFFKALQLRKHFGRYETMFALQVSQGAGAAWFYKLLNPKVKFVLNIQEGKNLKRQGFLINFLRKMIIKRADMITAISNYLADYVRKINPGADIRVIPNGVDLKKFKVKSLNLKVDEKTIITVSRLVSKNGVGDLIDAFHILNSKFEIRNSKLLIIGSGPLEESLKLKVKNLELGDKILFIGEIGHEQLPDYFSIADVFVRPSLSEGLGTAFLEAMACAVPVIGTAEGGIIDFLEDKKTGLFCKAGDPQDIAEKIDLLLRDQNLRESIVANARKTVEEKYDWDKIAEQYTILFHSLNI